MGLGWRLKAGGGGSSRGRGGSEQEGVRLMRNSVGVTLLSHCTFPSTDLIDFDWGALEMHCGTIRSVGSVASVKKLRNVQPFRQ